MGLSRDLDVENTVLGDVDDVPFTNQLSDAGTRSRYYRCFCSIVSSCFWSAVNELD